MSQKIKVAFASCSDELIPGLIQRMNQVHPDLPLVVVSEFPPDEGEWIPYHVERGFLQNLLLLRDALRGRSIRLAGLVLQPKTPYRRLRLFPLLLVPLHTVFFNENLDNFMIRPRSAPAILRHIIWRVRNLLRWQLKPGGPTYTFFYRLAHPSHLRRPFAHLAGLAAGGLAALVKTLLPAATDAVSDPPLPEGISVVVPSRDGRELLERLLPGLVRELDGRDSEIIVVDNGSSDGTGRFLAENYPRVIVEHSAGPLSFARAVNRGIRRARFSHTCLLNNDMVLEENFFPPLRRAFDTVPDLFCATAQIFFPEGVRREETGKAVMLPIIRGEKHPARTVFDFPVQCQEPLPREDLSYVLYGSGGCSLFSTVKLRRLGGVGEVFEPAYVEDLDLGYRGWQRGWPSVFVAGARVVHSHRATTTRYYSERQLASVLEVNYLRFLARSVASPRLFRRLWREALLRLNSRCANSDSGPEFEALRAAGRAVKWVERPFVPMVPEDGILALNSGAVAVFPGRAPRGLPVVAAASPYLPFPLSHGGAVRMYNLMKRAAGHCDQVLIAFAEELRTPPPELLELFVEIVLVRRIGTHLRTKTHLPDTVVEFHSPAFRAALRQTVRKWAPGIVQLEFTQMAQYAPDCRPARTVLVEHDVTFDLYAQLLKVNDDWEERLQYRRWVRFETGAWRRVDRVITMSEKDRVLTGQHGAPERAVVSIPNGVDLVRFRPAGGEPERARILFIGSFAHLPNLMAVAWFLGEVWPLLAGERPTLHIIAGSRHEYHLNRHKDRIQLDFGGGGIEVEGFVSDVRPAYERASAVIAPLVVSAGTNIKIMEAMAMGKAIVSTSRGINGLDVLPGRDLLLADGAQAFAEALRQVLNKPERRRLFERQARETAERDYNWDNIALTQRRLYEDLAGIPQSAAGSAAWPAK